MAGGGKGPVHASIGMAYGQKELAHDIRLACHGLDAGDNEFVIGLVGPELHPLSHLVQTMRKTKQTSEFIEKMKRGPVALITVLPRGGPSIGKSLAMWFLYSIVISIFAAYICSRVLRTGADYLDVFRYAGTTAFAGYSLALLQDSIWHGRAWGTTLRSVFDQGTRCVHHQSSARRSLRGWWIHDRRGMAAAFHTYRSPHVDPWCGSRNGSASFDPMVKGGPATGQASIR